MKRVIKSSYYYDDEEYDRVDRMGDPKEIAIAAIAYNYGISREEAMKEYEDIDEEKLRSFISYYFLRDIPVTPGGKNNHKSFNKEDFQSSSDEAAQDVCDELFG